MVMDGDGGDLDDVLDGEVESAGPLVNMRHQFNTLSGRETADYRNSWEMFERLLTQENSYRSAADHDTWSYSETNDVVNLVVSVEDTGVGIPLAVQDRVFTPFMQVRHRSIKDLRKYISSVQLLFPMLAVLKSLQHMSPTLL